MYYRKSIFIVGFLSTILSSKTAQCGTDLVLPKLTVQSQALYLLPDSSIKCWGSNSNGQLGNGNNINSPVPITVVGETNATKVSSGLFFSCALIRTEGINHN